MYDSIRYLVVDDDELDRLAVLNETSKYPFLQRIAVCSSAGEAMDYIDRFKPDLVFSDIEMPGTNGLEMMRSLYGKIPAPVFITSHPEYALESFDLEIFDYLLKPLSAERFERCMTRVQDFFRLRKMVMNIDNQHGDTEYIMVKQGYERYRLHHTDILYLEAMKDYTKIITRSGQHILVLETLSSMIRQLPGDKFMRTHRSYAVNREHINAVSHNRISILGQEIPVGKSFKHIISSWHNGYS